MIPAMSRWEERVQSSNHTHLGDGLLGMPEEGVLIYCYGCGKNHLNHGQGHSLGRGPRTTRNGESKLNTNKHFSLLLDLRCTVSRVSEVPTPMESLPWPRVWNYEPPLTLSPLSCYR